ncbi:glutamate decarboxylase [Micractinium conductrix]|uniref:glutamate decarboxylase n=1 Tax=Micractinium conductrix TaxID=554055 RepID=A0A2P6VL75_9CHLO|nr:glutamate decarboxylase [Micractinium conductrix]|eukprot:PSC74807.1 glutamate decarboxylase [Micractinium conductrix]
MVLLWQVEDMMLLDVNPRLNLSTFVNTWIEPEAEELMQKAASYNLADAVQYASAAEMEKRCINFLAHLWHAPDDNFVGTGAVGSSEACYLGGLALKKRWQAARRAAGKPADRPNIVVSHIAQVCWQKLCSYFDVEPHYVDVTEDCLGESRAAEKGKGVGGRQGACLLRPACHPSPQERGLEVPLHVDAANAGLVAPLCRPDVLFDFRLRHVASINVSGHKYGLVYCGCAFIVWRNREFLPRDMVFTVAYLGKEEENLTINFSRPGAQTSAQYYNFIRLGQEGYRRTFDNFFRIYNALRDKVERMGCFQILSTGDMPVLAFRLKPLEGGNKRPYNEYDIMMGLGEHRWMVPAYTMAPAASDMHLLRVCLRVGFDLEMADMLAHHLEQVISKLEKHTSPAVPSPGQAYVEEQSQRAKEFKRRAGPC